jgi:hypothetical protein
MIRRVLFLACAGLLAGCVTTYLDDRAINGHAAVVHYAHPINGGVVIEALDGKRPGVRIVNEYWLAPGEHSFRAHAQAGGYFSNPETRWFDAAPDGHYRIDTVIDRGSDSWGFSVVDERTGQRVDRALPAHEAPATGR